MTIDRNNYEMYFLLYVDNELPAEERNAVEKFVAENADLKTELELLISTTLPDDEIIYSAKNELYRQEITPDVLQEKMLMHLDKELEPSSYLSLEAEINSNEALKREWNILQQTKLNASEKVIFENKELLYRHERTTVISMRFWRAAAAAAIIGAGIFIGLSIYTKDKQPENVAVTDKNGKPLHKITEPVKKIIPVNKSNDQQQSDENLAASKIKTPVIPGKENISHHQQPANNLVSTSNKKNDAVKKNIITIENKNGAEKAMVQKETNNLPKPYFENINNPKSNQTLSPTVQDNIIALQNKNEHVKTTTQDIAQSNIKEPNPTVEKLALTDTRNSYAKNAVMDENDSETSNNHILFINEEKINRSKISGLFKKVKRVLTRNANIKTGNNVTIAGIDIAAR